MRCSVLNRILARVTRPSNKELKLPRHGPDGASPLNLVLGRPRVSVRNIRVAGVLLAMVACHTMIADKIVVTSPASLSTRGASADEIHVAVRETLTSLSLRAEGTFGDAEEWVWRDPEKPPGLHATVRRVSDGVQIRLSQDLFGPIGPTEKYRAVRNGLLESMKQRFGKSSVTIE
jgi:hypothetical protein